MPATVTVIIPARNEAEAIGHVLADLPGASVHEVVVVDNGSTDATPALAQAAGATVVACLRKGYGAACQAGLAHVGGAPQDIVVFLDGDHADDPRCLPLLLAPLQAGRADLVLGSRVLGPREPGALLPQQRLGNWLATTLMALGLRHRYTDLGPFRAVTREALDRLQMRSLTFGWTAEMQVKAILRGLRVREVAVPYRRRKGRSKIAGTFTGTVRAGIGILGTITLLLLAHWLQGGGSPREVRSRALTPAGGPGAGTRRSTARSP